MSLRSLGMRDRDVENALRIRASKIPSKLSLGAAIDIRQLGAFRFSESLMDAQTLPSNLPLRMTSSGLLLVC